MRKRGPCGRPVQPALPQSFSSWPPTVHGMLLFIQAKKYHHRHNINSMQSFQFTTRFFKFHRGSPLIPDGTVWEWAPTAVFGKMATFIFYTLTQALRAMKSGDLLFFFMRLSYVGLISDFCFYLLRTHSISDVDWPNLIKSYRRSSSYNRLYGINEWSRDRM